jgi:hypothetical protein
VDQAVALARALPVRRGAQVCIVSHQNDALSNFHNSLES